MIKKVIFVFTVSLLICWVHAQLPPDIAAFKHQDSIAFPAKGSILFVGSSSFTNWKDVQAYFPGYPIINRGFGGSSLPDVIRYANEIIFPYQPKQIVIYCGENDFGFNQTTAVDTVVMRFEKLFNLIREKMHRVPIAYISMKPSPSRKQLAAKMIQANKGIEDFLKTKKHTVYINIYDVMLLPNGYSNGFLFTKDSLHMNAAGYRIWQLIIKPYLLK